MSTSSVSVDSEKVEAMMSSFLGLAGYYGRFIEDFSRIAAPMKRLTEGGQV